ncbi:sialate O-acetylesterase [Terrimonas sp. NA20]|uniref:Sialate O-acetylesterase n=1 Tax=Terrimonas ginsenosidimutans TaxID=2908004 RepID=A0ABS9KSV6_9BACT|nr:sialate O-acetylesterase [Terrimonas ginsenosidimutans]MCG2615417.1 sialate O-acetylesterase [Terrimonas ginsenosidimutans]
MPRSFLVIIFSWIMLPAQSQLQMPSVFGDSMVLQRDAPIRLWGKAIPGENVTAVFHQQRRTVRADAMGEWTIVLSPEKAGGPYDLSVSANKTLLFKGILMGDIWVCSGQSNMEFPVKGWSSVNNAEAEIASANYPRIRLFTVEKNVSALPEGDLKGEWKTCSPSSIPLFSAVGYFFGRALHKELNVPVGLINSTWGGTPVETWISRDGFENDPYYSTVMQHAPELSMDALIGQRRSREQSYVESLQKDLPDLSDSARWKESSYDDIRWKKMLLPGLWESQPGLSRLDGIVWFRTAIDLSPEDLAGTAAIHLGMIDDRDDTYLNGERIGGMNGWNTDRVYTVRNGLLKPGRNVIAVRVEDGGNGGGIYGDSNQLFLSSNGKRFPLSGAWRYRIQDVLHSSNGIGPNDYPSLLYNGMIHPIERLQIKGVIWYQGEANTSTAYEYRKAMQLLIRDWRIRFSNPAMPFYFVQLTSFNAANGNSNSGSTWAELRESQAAPLRLRGTGMAVTVDLGDAADIHPRNKQDVGYRLALLALRNTYKKQVQSSGPVYTAMKKNDSSIVLSFSAIAKGLVVKGSGQLQGFEIAGADQRFYPAEALIVPGGRVKVYSSSVVQPVAVRYAWADDNGNANLFNSEGLPAAPFRTDQWPGITVLNKYDPSLK